MAPNRYYMKYTPSPLVDIGHLPAEIGPFMLAGAKPTPLCTTMLAGDNYYVLV
jgi:hypothetical protein